MRGTKLGPVRLPHEHGAGPSKPRRQLRFALRDVKCNLPISKEERPSLSELTDALRERAHAALPQVEGELKLTGLEQSVEVLWDRWGIPHVYAKSTHDLFFTQGYILASERLFQLELMLRFGSGRLSEIFGDLTLPLDRFIRTVGWNRAARRLTGQWDDLSWEMSDAFAAGARTWCSRMPAKPVEYEVLQLEPYFPEGREAAELAAAASVLMAWGLSTNWDGELLRMELAERLGWESMMQLFPEIMPEPAVVVAGKSSGGESPARLRSAAGGATSPRRPGLQQLGGGGAAQRERQAPLGQRPPSVRPTPVDLVRDPSGRARHRRARCGPALLPRRDHRAQRAHRLGDHESRRRYTGPVSGAAVGRRHSRSIQRRVGAAHRAPRGDRRSGPLGSRGRGGERDAPRPDPRLLSDWRGRPYGGRRRDPRDLLASMGGPRGRSQAVHRVSVGHRGQLRRVPRRPVRVGHARGQLRLRGRGRQHRLPGHREQPDPRRLVSVPAGQRFPSPVPSQADRSAPHRDADSRLQVVPSDPYGHGVPARSGDRPALAHAGAGRRAAEGSTGLAGGVGLRPAGELGGSGHLRSVVLSYLGRHPAAAAGRRAAQTLLRSPTVDEFLSVSGAAQLAGLPHGDMVRG